MERINWILNHPLYTSSYNQLKDLEKDRIFCCHQMPHLLDVARIAYIRNLEEHLGLDKEIIYAASLLHDIGKGKHEKPHVHFKDGNALNQDGTWKHGGRKLTNKEKKFLEKYDWKTE